MNNKSASITLTIYGKTPTRSSEESEVQLLKEEVMELTHTQIAKAKKIDVNILNLKGKLINHFLDRYSNVATVSEEKMLSAIKVVKNKRDDRTARNWLELLFEKGFLRRLVNGKIVILELDLQVSSHHCGSNEDIERQIITANAKADDEKAKLVLAKFGDLR